MISMKLKYAYAGSNVTVMEIDNSLTTMDILLVLVLFALCLAENGPVTPSFSCISPHSCCIASSFTSFGGRHTHS